MPQCYYDANILHFSCSLQTILRHLYEIPAWLYEMTILLTQFSYLAIICWVIWRLYIWYLACVHLFIWTSKPPLPQHTLYFSHTLNNSSVFSTLPYILFHCWKLFDHSQYLTTVCPSTFYGEGFWDAPFHPPERGSGF